MGMQEVVNAIRANNGRVIGEDRVQGFESIDAANAWLLENPERTAGGLHFNETSATTIDFVLQMNSTVKFFRGKAQNPVDFIGMPLQVAAHREITRCAYPPALILRSLHAHCSLAHVPP